MNKITRQRSLRCVHLREEHERSNDPRSSLSPEQSRYRAGIKIDAFDGHDISGLVSIFRWAIQAAISLERLDVLSD